MPNKHSGSSKLKSVVGGSLLGNKTYVGWPLSDMDYSRLQGLPDKMSKAALDHLGGFKFRSALGNSCSYNVIQVLAATLIDIVVRHKVSNIIEFDSDPEDIEETEEAVGTSLEL